MIVNAQRRPAVNRRSFLVAATVAIALLAAGWAGLKSLPASVSYVVEAEFEAMPATDAALEARLPTEPGVARVFVGQPAGEPRVLVVSLIMVRDGWGRPSFPDLEGICSELGYRGIDGRFRDCEGERRYGAITGR